MLLDLDHAVIPTVDLDGGGVLILAGPDTSLEITIMDGNGDGAAVVLNLTAATQVQNALLDRLLHIEARRRGGRREDWGEPEL